MDKRSHGKMGYKKAMKKTKAKSKPKAKAKKRRHNPGY